MLAALFGNSPFLSGLAVAEWDFLTRLVEEGADRPFEEIAATIEVHEDSGENRAALLRRLRIAKRRVALLAAVAELAGSWSLEAADGGAQPVCRGGDRRRGAPPAARLPPPAVRDAG